MIGEAVDGRDRLRAIADLLGIPVALLFGAEGPHPLLAAEECLHLWCRLKTDAGRETALEALRKVVASEGA